MEQKDVQKKSEPTKTTETKSPSEQTYLPNFAPSELQDGSGASDAGRNNPGPFRFIPKCDLPAVAFEYTHREIVPTVIVQTRLDGTSNVFVTSLDANSHIWRKLPDGGVKGKIPSIKNTKVPRKNRV